MNGNRCMAGDSLHYYRHLLLDGAPSPFSRVAPASDLVHLDFGRHSAPAGLAVVMIIDLFDIPVVGQPFAMFACWPLVESPFVRN